MFHLQSSGLSADHDPNCNDPQEIIQSIIQQLFVYINPSDVTYQAPNFIINVQEPVTQLKILENPLLNVGQSFLEMVPWSREHESAKIPWVTAHSPRIFIDPLTILPVTSKKTTWTGASDLKNNFALNIPSGYELKAPDYSYLIIAELKDLYKTKFSIFSQCAKVSQDMYDMMQQLCRLIKEITSSGCSCDQHIDEDAVLIMDPDSTGLLSDIKQKLLSTSVRTEALNIMPAPLSINTFVPLQLDSFTDAPMDSEIPLPETYTAWLRSIYNAAVERVFMTKPIIETIKTSEDRFQTFITIGEWTHRHHGGYKKSAVEQESSAICFSLKHITHIIGYSIVDLNYPTLSTLIQHIDTWNSQINLLHFRAGYALTETEAIHEGLSHLCHCHQDILHADRCSCLRNAVKQLISTAADTLTNMVEKSRMFLDLRARYYSNWDKSASLIL